MRKNKLTTASQAMIMGAAVLAAPASWAEGKNDGTDPTKLIRSFGVKYESLELTSGFHSQTMKFIFDQPIGDGRSALQFKLPVASVDVFGDNSFGIGDISFKYTKVASVTAKGGVVLSGEVFLDTADRPELGRGKNVFKPTIILARFLRDGSIFAPALLHEVSFGGDSTRKDINSTTIDLYYVPKLANPNLFMTIDPFATYDWENDLGFGGLAVTAGYRVGEVFGGNGQVFIKPSIAVGADRPFDWGVEVGFQVLNF